MNLIEEFLTHIEKLLQFNGHSRHPLEFILEYIPDVLEIWIQEFRDRARMAD